MSEKFSSKLKSFRKILFITTFISLSVAIICFSAPMYARKTGLTAIGASTISELQAFSISLSFFQGDELSTSIENPEQSKISSEISRLLAMICEQNAYHRAALIKKGVGTSYTIIADSQFRAEAIVGEEKFSLGDNYPFQIYKSAKSHADNILDGKKSDSYTTDLTILSDGTEITSSYMPIYDSANNAVAVLAVDLEPENTRYTMLGPLNLHQIGWISATIALIGGVLLFMCHRYLMKSAKPLEPDFEEIEDKSTEIIAIEGKLVEDKDENE